MVDVPIRHEDPVVQRTSLVDIVILMQRLSGLEKKVEQLSEVDHAEAIKEFNPINLFKPSSKPADSFTEYELKNMLYDKMQESGCFNEHEKWKWIFTKGRKTKPKMTKLSTEWKSM
ncbi:hypothetical protein Tco_1273983 [Tanacetum coccineum]